MPEPLTTTETSTAAPAEHVGVLGSLGINASQFIGQLINFLIVLFVVWRWVYRPLLKKMDERSEKIREGLAFSKEAEKARADAQSEFDRMISQAKSEANAILRDANEKAETLRTERLKLAKQEIEKIAVEAKAQIKAERQASYDALRGDIAELVAASLTKIGVSMDEKTRKASVHEAIKDIETS